MQTFIRTRNYDGIFPRCQRSMRKSRQRQILSRSVLPNLDSGFYQINSSHKIPTFSLRCLKGQPLSPIRPGPYLPKVSPLSCSLPHRHPVLQPPREHPDLLIVFSVLFFGCRSGSHSLFRPRIHSIQTRNRNPWNSQGAKVVPAGWVLIISPGNRRDSPRKGWPIQAGNRRSGSSGQAETDPYPFPVFPRHTPQHFPFRSVRSEFSRISSSS